MKALFLIQSYQNYRPLDLFHLLLSLQVFLMFLTTNMSLLILAAFLLIYPCASQVQQSTSEPPQNASSTQTQPQHTPNNATQQNQPTRQHLTTHNSSQPQSQEALNSSETVVGNTRSDEKSDEGNNNLIIILCTVIGIPLLIALVILLLCITLNPERFKKGAGKQQNSTKQAHKKQLEDDGKLKTTTEFVKTQQQNKVEQMQMQDSSGSHMRGRPTDLTIQVPKRTFSSKKAIFPSENASIITPYWRSEASEQSDEIVVDVPTPPRTEENERESHYDERQMKHAASLPQFSVIKVQPVINNYDTRTDESPSRRMSEFMSISERSFSKTQQRVESIPEEREENEEQIPKIIVTGPIEEKRQPSGKSKVERVYKLTPKSLKSTQEQ